MTRLLTYLCSLRAEAEGKFQGEASEEEGFFCFGHGILGSSGVPGGHPEQGGPTSPAGSQRGTHTHRLIRLPRGKERESLESSVGQAGPVNLVVNLVIRRVGPEEYPIWSLRFRRLWPFVVTRVSSVESGVYIAVDLTGAVEVRNSGLGTNPPARFESVTMYGIENSLLLITTNNKRWENKTSSLRLYSHLTLSCRIMGQAKGGTKPAPSSEFLMARQRGAVDVFSHGEENSRKEVELCFHTS